ncbi:MAG: Gfo/Idh/MocA family oxidoreductase [Phycisphaerae bacterium]|nr:Gfo/Idh/MocA family oxidoreductase [Phycisphaerae bacterium]
MSRGKELRIGVIGAGGRGSLAHHAHQPDEGARLVAAVDVKPAVLDAWQEKFGRDTFVTDDYRKLLARDDVEAVFVCSPDYLHEEHAVAALQAGKHVYLEKPMAITIAGCDRILQAAYEKKLKLYLGHNMRHMAFVQKMKELIDSGAIGEVRTGWCRHFVAYGCDAYFKTWHADRTRSTGLLLQKAAHDIDVLHWLCGGYTVRTNAMGNLSVYNRITDRHAPDEYGDNSWHKENWPPLSQKQLNPIIDVEDLSMMHMQLDNGVLCSYQQCHYTPDSWRNYTIIGTEGRIENFNDYPAKGEAVVALWNQRCDYKAHGDVQYRISVDEGSHGGADPKIVAEFVRYVREGGKILTSPIAARNSVAAGCQATESIRNGGIPLDIPPVPEELAEYFNADLAK